MDKFNLQAGFSRVTVNPHMGIDIVGYYKERKAEGILDNLEVNVLAVKKAEKTVLFVAIDLAHLSKEVFDRIKIEISNKTGVDINAIFVHTTHTHTGPGYELGKVDEDKDAIKMVDDYMEFLIKSCVDGAIFALADLKPAKMGYGVGQAPKIAFIRRFRMKDGSVKTNPGVNNPDIVEPIGQVDERVSVVRFDREGGKTIVLVNFGNHPDTVGGNLISGDWPTLTRHFVEKAIENTLCIFFNGAQGDVNHVNVHPQGGDFNDMFNDFDGCSRGYGHTRHMARVVTGGVLQVYDKVKYIDVDEIKYEQRYVDIPSNKATKEQLELAHKYNDLHLQGKDDQIPFKAMELTTVVAEAARMVRLENGPDAFPMLFSAVSIGGVALFGIPGEPFNWVGREIKKTDGYELVIPCCLTNGAEGYFPTKDAYDEGGYEARSSSFKAGVAEKIVDTAKVILADLIKA